MFQSLVKWSPKAAIQSLGPIRELHEAVGNLIGHSEVMQNEPSKSIGSLQGILVVTPMAKASFLSECSVEVLRS